jgi:hypothetical protein
MRCPPRQRAKSRQPTASGRCRWTARAEPFLVDSAAPRTPSAHGRSWHKTRVIAASLAIGANRRWEVRRSMSVLSGYLCVYRSCFDNALTLLPAQCAVEARGWQRWRLIRFREVGGVRARAAHAHMPTASHRHAIANIHALGGPQYAGLVKLRQ